MQPQDSKLVALRTKTDQELFTILAQEIEGALKTAVRNPAAARGVHARAIALLPGMLSLDGRQKVVLLDRMTMLGERLGLAIPPEADPWLPDAHPSAFRRCGGCMR